jgi:hypothetical protein
MRGRSHLFVTKDRPGHLRRHGRPTKTPGKTLLGELVVDDEQRFTPDLELTLYPTTVDNEPETAAVSPLADQVWAAVHAAPEHQVESERRLFALVRQRGAEARDTQIRRAVDDLLAADLLAELPPGKRGAIGYRTTASTTASQDPSQVCHERPA